MKKKALVILVIFSAIFWLSILVSISLFLFYWRTVNEPGILTVPVKLLRAHKLLFWSGIAGTLSINILFIIYREKRAWIAWIANLAASIIYAPFMILTLIMMV